MNYSHLLTLIIILAYLSQTSVCQTHQEEANARANRGSLSAIGSIPRYGGDATLDRDDFSDPLPYLTGIISIVAIPILFVALSVLLCPFWTLCRCCKCCCCRKKRPKDPITKCQIYTPYFIVFSCVVAIVAMVAIAYGANVDFSGALLYNEGEGVDGNLFGVAEEFMSDGVNKTYTIKLITMSIKENVISAIDGVQDILNDTSILTVGSTTLINMLYSISNLWNGYNVTTTYDSQTYSFECTFCTTFSQTINNITNQIDDQTGPIFESLNSTVSAIGSTLLNVEGDIIEQIDGFIEQIGDVHDEVMSAEDTVLSARPAIEDYNNKREIGYNIIFAIPLLPILFILFGGILKKPGCFTLSYICLWFSCTVMWLLLMLHLPIAVLLNDTCHFLDVLDANVTQTFNNTMGQIFEACLTNERLTETLGVGAALNFTNAIQFPSLGNITQEFEFSDLLNFQSDALSTNFSTFYANGDAALVVVNNLTLSSPANGFGCCKYSRTNISTLNSSEYYAFNSTLQVTLENLKNILMAESGSISAFNETIYKIRNNLSSVSNQVIVIETNVQQLANNVENASILLNPLFNDVDDMIDTARCGFIGDAYIDTKAVMCSAVLGALSRIVVSMFVIAVLSLFSCIWSVKLVRKVEWFQKQKQEDKDSKLQQSFQPNKPTVVVMQPLIHSNQYQPGGNIAPAQAMYYNRQI